VDVLARRCALARRFAVTAPAGGGLTAEQADARTCVRFTINGGDDPR